MTCKRIILGRKTIFRFLLLQFLFSASVSGAESVDERQLLQIFYKDSGLVETPTRSPKSMSRVAENLTVITAEDIEAINAHTLANILVNVTGVQTAVFGSPGSIADVLIQGSETRPQFEDGEGTIFIRPVSKLPNWSTFG